MSRDTILFDINETVLDLATLQPNFASAFGDEGVTATWFARLLHASTVCALTGVSTTFAELAGHSLDELAARRAVALTTEQRADILGGFASLPPYADVAPALRRLRAAGYRTVAFTNSSLALVERQLEASGLASDFDDVVSVEKTGSFKPEAMVYRYVADRVARAPNELRLVAAHDWDTHGALAAGLLAAYINRSGAPYHPLYQRPDVFADEMTSLVEQVIARDASPDGAG